MTYIRKTHDEYEVQGNYGEGWDLETVEMTWKEAKTQLKCYRENGCGEYRIVKKRVPNNK